MDAVRIKWRTSWSSEVDDALACLPLDPLSEPELLRRLWELNRTAIPIKVGIVSNRRGEVVGVVPLKRRGRWAWQLLTHYCMPYAKLLVLPEYLDALLRELSRDVDCPNIALPKPPRQAAYLRPEESWLIDTSGSYDTLMTRRKYARDDRYIRRKSEMLTTHEDVPGCLPTALEEWRRNWMARGSPYTAVLRDEILVACEYLKEQSRLKTICVCDGERPAAFAACVLEADTAYNTFISVWDEYRSVYAGMRVVLDTVAWACRSEIATLDLLRTSTMPKHKWAEPLVCGYRLVRCPLGSQTLGRVMSGVKDYAHRRRSGLLRQTRSKAALGIPAR